MLKQRPGVSEVLLGAGPAGPSLWDTLPAGSAGSQGFAHDLENLGGFVQGCPAFRGAWNWVTAEGPSSPECSVLQWGLHPALPKHILRSAWGP